ncbi:MAG: 3-deoxy-7-phosphoheptulonate synthase [Lachnospiraceae bacterium]|nr:3-deoxy-7-phosphoheptulonate synthase [Lachnospiraceae bacterium]
MNMEYKREMPSPEVIKEMIPLEEGLRDVKQENDRQIRHVLKGKDDRLLLIIGPCSADREDAVLDYVTRLRAVQEKVKDKILIVPRMYTKKPRTTGEGYKGMLHQPDPAAAPDMLRGLISSRQMLIHALSQTGFSCADEMLYPDSHPYLSDVLSYVAVGARSVENQLHRLTASGLDIPVGMKNPTSGDLSVMMNAITAAQHGHVFVYSNWEVQTYGNHTAHAVLRGYSDPSGRSVPNYHYDDLRHLADLYAEASLHNPAVIVDCNHCNSGKHYAEQPRIAAEVLHSMRRSEEIGRLVKGLMVESYLVDGCQSAEGGVYGQSITDPCLGWEKTERMIYDIAEAR